MDGTDAPVNRDAGWYEDESGRHQLRFWDGAAWTVHVSDAGVVSQDSPFSQPPAGTLAPPTVAAATDPAPEGAGPVVSKARSRRGRWLLIGAAVIVVIIAVSAAAGGGTKSTTFDLERLDAINIATGTYFSSDFVDLGTAGSVGAVGLCVAGGHAALDRAASWPAVISQPLRKVASSLDLEDQACKDGDSSAFDAAVRAAERDLTAAGQIWDKHCSIIGNPAVDPPKAKCS